MAEAGTAGRFPDEHNRNSGTRSQASEAGKAGKPPNGSDSAIFRHYLGASTASQDHVFGQFFGIWSPKRKFFATTTSLIVNCLTIVAMLIIPLAFPEALPKAQLLTFLVAPPPPPPPPPPAAAEVQHVVRQIQTDMLNNGALRTPTKIPQKIQMIKEEEEEAPPPMPASGGVVGGVPGGIPGGQMGGAIGSVINATSSLAAVPKFVPATPQRIRISAGVTKGLLIQRIEPPYPTLARAHEFRGTSC
jgi:hypothetical protein